MASLDRVATRVALPDRPCPCDVGLRHVVLSGHGRVVESPVRRPNASDDGRPSLPHRQCGSGSRVRATVAQRLSIVPFSHALSPFPYGHLLSGVVSIAASETTRRSQTLSLTRRRRHLWPQKLWTRLLSLGQPAQQISSRERRLDCCLGSPALWSCFLVDCSSPVSSPPVLTRYRENSTGSSYPCGTSARHLPRRIRSGSS